MAAERQRTGGVPAPPDHDRLRISLLGRFRIAGGATTIDAAAWRLRRAAALIKMLALAVTTPRRARSAQAGARARSRRSRSR